MKAIVLAAGVGSRLKPITDAIPKALIPINGKPMLEHIILKLKKAGFSHIVINVHHFADQIIELLRANDHFGLKIDISDERNYLLGTGGGIKQAFSYLNCKEPFLVHNVDILSNVDLKEMYDSHIESKALATLLVNHRRSARQLLFDKNNHLCGWRNRETGEIKSFYPNFDPSKHLEFAFGGVHVISPDIFNLMEEWTGKFSIIHFYLSICTKSNIQPFTANDVEIIDMGKDKIFEEANEWAKKHLV